MPARDKGSEAEVTSRRAFKPREIEAALARASRLIHLGRRAADVLPGLAAGAGERVARAAAAALLDDEGLAGRVFIRESAFPGLRQGRWDEVLRRLTRSARYLLSEKPADGFRKFGLEVVAAVPWAEALRAYESDLSARGARAGGGDPKEVLRRALAANPDLRPASRRVPALDPAPSRSPRAAEPVKSPEQVAREAAEKLARRLVGLAMRRGRLTETEGQELLASGKSPEAVYAELDRRAALPREVGDYQGVADRYGSAQQAVRNMGLRPSETAAAPKNFAPAQLRKRVAQLLLRGALTVEDARRVLSIPTPAATYGGDGVNFDPRRQAARDLSLSKFDDGKALEGRLAARRQSNAEFPVDRAPEQLRKRVAQMLLRGEIDASRARGVLAGGWEALGQYLAAPGQLPRTGPPQSVVQPYTGFAHRAGGSYRGAEVPGLSAADEAVARAAAAAGCAPQDVSRYLQWRRQAAGRGLAPEVVEHEARLRFPEALLVAAESLAGDDDPDERVVQDPGSPHEFSFIPDAGWNPGGSR